MIQAILNRILTSLYPASCLACDALLDAPGLCLLCNASCEVIGTCCPTCSEPVAGPRDISCRRCTAKPPPVASCTAVFEYGGQLAVALKRLKFSGRSDIAKSLSPLLAGRFAKVAKHCSLAIPIPLHKRRLRQRGFNQAQRLLVPLAAEHGLAIGRNALHRVRDTEAQARLNARERRANMNSAFSATEKIRGQRILLLDDIRTTGETLHAATRALLRAGASQVHCFVVARAEWGAS